MKLGLTRDLLMFAAYSFVLGMYAAVLSMNGGATLAQTTDAATILVLSLVAIELTTSLLEWRDDTETTKP